jgi:hypothetical protein
VASRDADRATVDTCGREVGRPKSGKARMIGLARWLRDMLAEQLTRPAPGAGPEHTAFHAASGKAVYRTVFVRGVFGPAEAALPAEKQGRRFHDLRHLRATLLIAAGAHAKRVRERLGHSSITATLNPYGHVLRCTEAALVDALYEQCGEGDDAAGAWQLNEHVGSSSFNAWLSSEAQAKAGGYVTRSPVASSRRAPKSAAQRAPWSSGSRAAAAARSSRPPPYGGSPSLERVASPLQRGVIWSRIAPTCGSARSAITRRRGRSPCRRSSSSAAWCAAAGRPVTASA